MILHPTSHPQIVFAKGSLLGKESFSLFDGILAFVDYRWRGMRNTVFPCPYRIHSANRREQEIYNDNLDLVVRNDLTYLADRRCRKIGIHVPDDIDSAQIAIRAAVNWLSTESNSVDTLYFVDLHDDYYNCFGFESFSHDLNAKNLSPTEFESFYEHEFTSKMARFFGFYKPDVDLFCPRYCQIRKRDIIEDYRALLSFNELVDVLNEFNKRGADRSDFNSFVLHTFPIINFSVGLFYTALVPQTVAKVTGKWQAMLDFCKVSEMPVMNLEQGGSVAPHVFLDDTGLLPKNDEDISGWLRLARDEFNYFCRILIFYIKGGIKEPKTELAKRLHEISDRQLMDIRREMKLYLDSFEACLKGGPALANYSLPEEISSQRP